MVVRLLIISLLKIFLAQEFAIEIVPGASPGAQISETPNWFKESFLEFEEDVAEAATDGRQSAVRQRATELDIAYTPSVVFFESNDVEVMRIGSFMKTFYFQSVYDYVLQKAYLHESGFQRYISERAKKSARPGSILISGDTSPVLS